ncbi:response regulator [Phenylobacterium sp. LjRoot219]|uniref:response regulator n=1 Tax=Phenylobacterium sp. LjRoot219 TaxID=3342283 RepID=UPI003ECE1B7C
MDLGAVRILVVDDNRQARELIKAVLASAGAREIRHAVSAHDAFELMRSEPIDLVFLDQNLGEGGEGIALARRIRHDPASPNPFVALLMLTGHADAQLVRAARDAGVNEFLAKPFTVAGLLKRVEALIFQPRPFVRAADYVGPDRRRRDDSAYNGTERRARRD